MDVAISYVLFIYYIPVYIFLYKENLLGKKKKRKISWQSHSHYS